MEQLSEVITLDSEEINELAFKLKVEGADSPVKVRLVCENGDMSYMFAGRGTSEDGIVQFVVPQMKNKLQEGTYPARVEVLIDNRYFIPVEFQMHFKKTMQVFAESVKITQAQTKPDIRVSAVPVVVTRTQPQPQPSPIKFDQKVETKSAEPVKKPSPASSTINTLRETYLKKSAAQSGQDADPEALRKAREILRSKLGK